MEHLTGWYRRITGKNKPEPTEKQRFRADVLAHASEGRHLEAGRLLLPEYPGLAEGFLRPERVGNNPDHHLAVREMETLDHIAKMSVSLAQGAVEGTAYAGAVRNYIQAGNVEAAEELAHQFIQNHKLFEEITWAKKLRRILRETYPEDESRK